MQPSVNLDAKAPELNNLARWFSVPEPVPVPVPDRFFGHGLGHASWHGHKRKFHNSMVNKLLSAKWGSYLILIPNLKSDHVQVFVLKILLKILKLIPKDTKIAEAKLEMILRIVVLASAGNKTIHHIRKNHKGTPTGVTVRNTLKLMFSDISLTEEILNRLLSQLVNKKVLRGSPIVNSDVLLVEYYGSEEKDVEEIRSRFGIETSHRQMHEARARTASRSPVLRYFFVGMGFILRNVWIYLHFHILYKKRQGARCYLLLIWIPAFAEMTRVYCLLLIWILAFAGITGIYCLLVIWIPAFAGMTCRYDH